MGTPEISNCSFEIRTKDIASHRSIPLLGALRFLQHPTSTGAGDSNHIDRRGDAAGIFGDLQLDEVAEQSLAIGVVPVAVAAKVLANLSLLASVNDTRAAVVGAIRYN